MQMTWCNQSMISSNFSVMICSKGSLVLVLKIIDFMQDRCKQVILCRFWYSNSLLLQRATTKLGVDMYCVSVLSRFIGPTQREYSSKKHKVGSINCTEEESEDTKSVSTQYRYISINLYFSARTEISSSSTVCKAPAYFVLAWL